MRKKLPVLDRTRSIEVQNNNPGAGRYENPESLSPSGRYSVSKHKGTGATLFNPKRSIRFFEFSISSKTQKIATLVLETMRKLTNSVIEGAIQLLGSKDMDRDCLTRLKERICLTIGQGRTEILVLALTDLRLTSGTTTEMSMGRQEAFPTQDLLGKFQGYLECLRRINPDVNNPSTFSLYNHLSLSSIYITLLIETTMTHQRKQNRCVEHQQQIVALCIDQSCKQKVKAVCPLELYNEHLDHKF